MGFARRLPKIRTSSQWLGHRSLVSDVALTQATGQYPGPTLEANWGDTIRTLILCVSVYHCPVYD